MVQQSNTMLNSPSVGTLSACEYLNGTLPGWRRWVIFDTLSNTTGTNMAMFLKTARLPKVGLVARNYSTQRGTSLQEEMMEHEQVLAVDHEDRPVGRLSKKEAHTGIHTQGDRFAYPLHRGFSLLHFKLFPAESHDRESATPSDSQVKMMITRRARSKFTFPGLLTNCCCSHPLVLMQEVGEETCLKIEGKPRNYTMEPTQFSNKLSFPPSTADIEGVKVALKRKLMQELGMSLPSELRFMTRLHYLAADRFNPPWGEHEIDYLFVSLDPNSETQLKLNRDEVDEVLWLDRKTLAQKLETCPETFTPWSRVIFSKLATGWWQALEKASNMETLNDLVQPAMIHRSATWQNE